MCLSRSIEPTSALPLAGETRPGTDEPTGGDPAGDTKPGGEEKSSDETKSSEDPASTPDSSHKPGAMPEPASTKMLATKTTKKTKPATAPTFALPKTGDGDRAVACLVFASLGMSLISIKVWAPR